MGRKRRRGGKKADPRSSDPDGGPQGDLLAPVERVRPGPEEGSAHAGSELSLEGELSSDAMPSPVAAAPAVDQAAVSDEAAPSDVAQDIDEGEEAPRPAEPVARTVVENHRRSVFFELVSENEPEAVVLPPAGELLARAKELVKDGRVDDAARMYRAILTENPSSVKARNNLGAMHEALGQYDLALEQFEAAAKIEPENIEVLNNLGSLLGVLGRYEEAEALLSRARRLAPDDMEVRASVGILHFRRGIYGVAESELRWVCERDAEHGDAFFYRGEALNRLGRYDEAMAALEHATVVQPQNAKAYYTLGILYDRKHLPEEAALMYRKARELHRG